MTRHGGQPTDITDVLKMPKAECRSRKERRFLNQEKRKGISEIEGKGAMGSAERALAVSEFQMRKWARGFCVD